MYTRERRQLKLFVRRDIYGRFLSCLVYLPRDRYNTTVRERIAAILKEQLGGDTSSTPPTWASRSPRGCTSSSGPAEGEQIGEPDVPDLERRCAEAARSWRDDFTTAVISTYGEEQGSRLVRHYADCFPEAYKEDYPPQTGAVDLGRLEEIEGDEGLALSLYEDVAAPPGEARLKVYRIGPPLSLSEVLPILSTMGVEVVDERPYQLEGLERESYIYDFGLRYHRAMPDHARELFQDTVAAVWDGRNESDGFNALVLAAGLTWRQATRAARLREVHAPGRHAVRAGLHRGRAAQQRRHHPLPRAALRGALRPRPTGRNGGDIAADSEARQAKCAELEERIMRALDEVSSLDHDRILRSYLTDIRATLRTNFFQTDADGRPLDRLSLKLDPSAIPELPEPRPKFEIFVYSPRVEGVHLRFGVGRARRAALVRPTRRLPHRGARPGQGADGEEHRDRARSARRAASSASSCPTPADRDAWMAEGIACYTTFISGLLDVTDNLVDGPRGARWCRRRPWCATTATTPTSWSPPTRAPRRSATSPTGSRPTTASGSATRSPPAARSATTTRRWASPPRGAWVSVRRHFREMGVDCQSEDFTCVGVGDMSGDVFGNGMLCSEHTRLVAAFDHRDIFLDPDPDAATSYAERRRLFDLPRSSWQDYDTSLISAGGGVFPRSAKSIPITPADARGARPGRRDQRMTPAELMRAILLAPVDLLWNGGIGTYVKAAAETHAEAGDKANDAIRVNGRELRAQCVGEGGNLGLHPARPRSSTPSWAAVRRPDQHRLHRQLRRRGHLRPRGEHQDPARPRRRRRRPDRQAAQRAARLDDRRGRPTSCSPTTTTRTSRSPTPSRWRRRCCTSTRTGCAPSSAAACSTATSRRCRPGARSPAASSASEGLTAPELSVLMAYTKIVLAEELLDSDLPDDPFFRSELFSYFPAKMRQGYRGQMEEHQLRREIVVTQIVNQLVNNAGITYFHRLAGRDLGDARPS